MALFWLVNFGSSQGKLVFALRWNWEADGEMLSSSVKTEGSKNDRCVQGLGLLFPMENSP